MRIPDRLRYWLIRKLCAGIALRREPNFVIGGGDQPYMRRWHVIKRNAIFNIYLHHILRSDDDRALHDHPFANLSVILTGGYTEILPTKGATTLKVRRISGEMVFRWPASAHRLSIEDPRYCAWTLFITGPRVREWGFWCPQGWRPWQQFVNPANRGGIGPGCG